MDHLSHACHNMMARMNSVSFNQSVRCWKLISHPTLYLTSWHLLSPPTRYLSLCRGHAHSGMTTNSQHPKQSAHEQACLKTACRLCPTICMQ